MGTTGRYVVKDRSIEEDTETILEKRSNFLFLIREKTDSFLYT
jgi:hypothetical protein